MRAALISSLILFCSSTALADAVPPPMPIECASGSFGATNHCGTVCVVDACNTDADCDAGERCGLPMLCVEDVSCGGWGATVSIAHGACGEGSTCAEGACQSVHACVPATEPRDAGATGGPEHATWNCGCHVAGASDRSGLAALAGLALALVVGVRSSRSVSARGSRRAPPRAR